MNNNEINNRIFKEMAFILLEQHEPPEEADINFKPLLNKTRDRLTDIAVKKLSGEELDRFVKDLGLYTLSVKHIMLATGLKMGYGYGSNDISPETANKRCLYKAKLATMFHRIFN